MKTIEITIPDEIFGVLDSIAKKKDKFVVEAIEEKLEREKRLNLQEILAEGYRTTAKEDLGLTKEFEAADLEKI